MLVRAPRGSLRPVYESVLYAQEACSRGYKLRSGEGPGPKSPGGCGERMMVLAFVVVCGCVACCLVFVPFGCSSPSRVTASPFIIQRAHVYKG
jgi:hypothetical protein